MKKTKQELRRTAKRAVETRKSRKRHEDYSNRGRKAWRETIKRSEYGYIDEIAKNQNIKRERTSFITMVCQILWLSRMTEKSVSMK